MYALLQLNPLVGDIEGNARAILDAACLASTSAHLCITPELALIGSPAHDVLLFADCEHRIHTATTMLAEELARRAPDTALVLGSLARAKDANAWHNQAQWIAGGGIQARYTKQTIQTHACFDENRFFTAGSGHTIVEWQGRRYALAFEADVTTPPCAAHLAAAYTNTCDTLVVLAATPFIHGAQTLRGKILADLATGISAELIYVNQAGANDEHSFPGSSVRINPAGAVTHRAAAFVAETCLVAAKNSTPKNPAPLLSDEAALWQALVTGVRDYVRKSGMRSVLLGLSGGVDSALVAAIACDALGPENVMGVLMPSPWSSEHSLADAHALARNLKMPTQTIPIAEGMRVFDTLLAPAFAGKAPDVTEENIQARIRGIILMAQSNKFGSLLLATGNKSESFVGYCTLYGDTCGALAVIADLFKTEVYHLCAWYNRKEERIPDSILTKAPSAELCPGQTDQDSLPPYDILDDILRRILDHAPYASLLAGHTPEHVEQVCRLVQRSEFKRRQAAPALRVSAQSVCTGWHMPLAAVSPYTR